MIGLPVETRVWLASGATDMRRGFDGLALLVQEKLKQDPHCGQLFVFRGKSGKLIKIFWYDGLGASLYAKRLEKGRFVWPATRDGVWRDNLDENGASIRMRRGGRLVR